MPKIISHSLIYILARGAPGVINVIALAVYSRFLTAEEYGYYAIVFSVIVFVYSVLFQWICLSLSRFFPVFSNTEGFLKNILLIFIYISACTAILSIIAMFIFKDPKSCIFFGLCTALLWGYAWFELTLELMRCRLMPVRYGIIFISKAVFTLLFSFVLINHGYGAWGIIFGTIAAIFMISLFSFKKEWGKVWQQQKNPQMMKELIQYGLPLIPTTSLTVVVMSADRLLLGWFLGAREAGLYATSYDLTASTMYLSLMAIYLASYPFITRALEQGGILQAQHQLRNYFHILLAVSVPASVGFAVLSANISHVMLGEEFWTASTEFIPWISIISLATGLRMFYFDLSFHLSKNTSKLIWISFTVAAISIIFNFLFIPYYGCMSVVYVGLLATILGCIASWWMGRKIFLLPSFSPDLGKIILASFAMASTLWPLRHLFGKEYLLLQIGVGVFSYGIIGLILNIADCRKKLMSFRTELLKIKSL